MLKRSLCILLSCTMLTLTGCGLSSKTKDKLFGDSDVTEVVYSAVQYSNYELLDEYFSDGKVSKDLMNSMLGTAIHLDDNYRMTNYLFEHGADPNADNRIWELAYNGYNLQIMPFLENEKTDLNKKNESGHSALYMALENQSGGNEWYTYMIAKEMLDRGAEVESYFFENHDSGTGYHLNPYSQLMKSPRTTRMLFKKFNEDGKTIDLPIAVQKALSGDITECLKAVSESSSDLDDGDKILITTYASYFGSVDEYKELSKLLSSDYAGSYRHIAMCGNTEMLDYFFEIDGVELEVDEERYKNDGQYFIDYYDWSECLDYAASFGEYDTCQYLLDNHLKPLQAEGYNSLGNALISGDMDVVKLIYYHLVEEYDEITEKQLGHTLMQLGKTYGRLDSYSEYKKDVFEFFFSEGFDLSEVIVSQFNSTDLQYLLENGMPASDEVVSELILKDDIVNLKYIIDNGYKPTEDDLIRAVNISSSEIVKLFMDNGASMPNDILNCTNHSSKATVKLLIDSGADTNIKLSQIPTSGGAYKNGEFSLKEYWEAYGRDDLVKLLK